MRFRLIDLLWLTLVCAVSLGWYADRSSLWNKLRSETFSRFTCEEVSKTIHDAGGWDNVHAIELVYSRWYGTEWKIMPVETNKEVHFRVTGPASQKSGTLENYDDPTLSWPLSTMMK